MGVAIKSCRFNKSNAGNGARHDKLHELRNRGALLPLPFYRSTLVPLHPSTSLPFYLSTLLPLYPSTSASLPYKGKYALFIGVVVG